MRFRQFPVRARLLAAALFALMQGVYAEGDTQPQKPAQPGAPAATTPPPAGATGADTKKSASISLSDRKFVRDVMEDSMAEVEMSKLATEKSQSAEVRDFAQQMVKDHTATTEELKRIANRYGMELPTDAGFMQKRKIDGLRNESPTAFDRKYIEAQTKDHDEDVKDFEKYAAKSTNAQLKSFAEKTLPKLKEHQQKAHALAQQSGNK